MSVDIYPNKETKEKKENQNRFEISFPFEAAIDERMINLTLEQIGKILTNQFSRQGVVGVSLIEIRFSKIYNQD